MNKTLLEKHIKLCTRNLNDKRVKCCAECPFEDELTEFKPELKEKFNKKKAGVAEKLCISLPS